MKKGKLLSHDMKDIGGYRVVRLLGTGGMKGGEAMTDKK